VHETFLPARLLAWRAAIAQVPQSVYLTDSSFADNIAFGILPEQINMDRVRHAARQAQIADFIETSPGGYDGVVGERGVRLSGGQRQRIGIARALYRQAQVLVFDEATNALDDTTEQAVMEAIESLSRDLTIILIAHRLTTVARCDRVLELDGGRFKAEGSASLVA
jgi:ATP-binding cassette subfamily B protein